MVKHNFPLAEVISSLNCDFQLEIPVPNVSVWGQGRKKICLHKHQETDYPVLLFRYFSMVCFWLPSQLLYVNRRPCVLQGVHLRLIKCYVTPASVQASFLQRLTSPGARSPPTPPW